MRTSPQLIRMRRRVRQRPIGNFAASQTLGGASTAKYAAGRLRGAHDRPNGCAD